MGYFSDTVAYALNGGLPRFGLLAEFLFDTPIRLWSGNRTIDTLDSKTWIGARQLGEISGLEEALNGEATNLSVSVSGANISTEIMQMALNEDPAGYKFKLLRIWLQFFDDDWKCLDNPYALSAGLITGLPIDWAPDGSGTVRRITVEAANIFYGRSAAPNGYWTDSDQQARYSGDIGMQFIPELQDTEIAIPW